MSLFGWLTGADAAQLRAEAAARRHEATARAQRDQLREWEQRLTPAERHAAFEWVGSQGWDRGMEPPPFVWQGAYEHVARDKRP